MAGYGPLQVFCLFWFVLVLNEILSYEVVFFPVY